MFESKHMNKPDLNSINKKIFFVILLFATFLDNELCMMKKLVTTANRACFPKYNQL
jgi:hypothetical protein